jgi:hypothetical protein
MIVLFAKYNQIDQVEEDEIGGACSTNGEKRNAYRLSVRKPEGKRPLGRLKHRWVDGWMDGSRRGGMGWCGLYCSGSG